MSKLCPWPQVLIYLSASALSLTVVFKLARLLSLRLFGGGFTSFTEPAVLAQCGPISISRANAHMVHMG